jgi:hypothetical protein
MALRDEITVTLDQSVPVKDRVIGVVARSPGGVVKMSDDDPFVRLEEQTRSGKVKGWLKVHKDHVVRIVFTSGK